MMGTNEITMDYFFEELKKKVSATNAKLLLHTARTNMGMNLQMDSALKKEEAQALCLELIKHGGPGFQVGRAIYSQMNQQ